MKDNDQILSYLQFLKKQPRGTVYADTPAQQAPTKAKSHKEQLKALRITYQKCTRCPLSAQGRTQVVFGAGNANAQLMFVGEGPGRDEDLRGTPFIGRAGKLLMKILEAMGLSRDEVYISNVVKCRPPNNRAPLPDESDTCKNSILYKEIEIIRPKIICTLGATATQALLGDNIRISKARGIFSEFTDGVLILPTYHPAYLLRNPASKKDVWADMQKITEKLSPTPKT